MVELSADVIALLEGPNNAHLATIMPDGSPHSVPVWVGMEDGHLAIQTGTGSRKARNIARDPRVAVSVTLRDQPFTMAAIRGRVVERLDGDAALLIVDRLSIKYTGYPYPQRGDRDAFLMMPSTCTAWLTDDRENTQLAKPGRRGGGDLGLDVRRQDPADLRRAIASYCSGGASTPDGSSSR